MAINPNRAGREPGAVTGNWRITVNRSYLPLAAVFYRSLMP